MDSLAPQGGMAALGAVALRNARIVLEDRVVEGDLHLSGGRITDGPVAGAVDVDCHGDYLLPGLIDLHTDNIEHHFQPRPGVRWPSATAAVLAHDWQLIGSGITTVLDALSLGDYDSGGRRTQMLSDAIGGITGARQAGLLKADHHLHFRCELSDAGLVGIIEAHIGNPLVLLLSVMDHTPGQRQWHDLTLYREFRRKKNNQVWTDEEFAAYVGERRAQQSQYVPQARELIRRVAAERGIRMASHDDTTIEDVEQSHVDGITISEFPTTLEAARQARLRGMRIVMGSPNLVLGGSHSGNVGAMDLADEGLLDVLTSDYVPGSLLHAAFLLGARTGRLPEAIATVTAIPADLLGLGDRGRIAPGLRADLLRVRLVEDLPVLQGVWAGGRSFL